MAKGSLDDPEVIATLCGRLIGGMSMDQACALPDGPSKTLVYQRMASDDDFRTIIVRAREAQQHAMVDETVDLADSATPEDWPVIKLRIWARQWRAGKLLPKVYGDRIQQEVTGDLSVHRVLAEAPLSEAEWAEANADKSDAS